MKGAILIIGGTFKSRLGQVEKLIQKRVHPADITTVEPEDGKKSIGIEQIRKALAVLDKKPSLGDFKALIIPNAEKLTPDAQNTLLKTLEEPPSYALIILAVKTEAAVLPTIISRCQKVFAGLEEGRGERGSDEENPETVSSVKKMTIHEKFDWAQEKAKEDKNVLIELLEEWVWEERSRLTSDNGAASNIKALVKIKEDLEKTNVNTRLALDTLLLNLG